MEKVSEIEGHMSFIEEDYNDLKLHNSKQSVEEIFIQGLGKTTKQMLFDEGFFLIILIMQLKYWKELSLQEDHLI